MKNKYLFILFLMPVFGHCQQAPNTTLPLIPSLKYSWKNPETQETKVIRTTQLFQGRGHDMEYLQMEACGIQHSKKATRHRVPPDEEHLLLVKSGTLYISFRDSSWSLSPGSIALLMPQEKYQIQNKEGASCRFYRMTYRSKLPVDVARGEASGGSFVKAWKTLSFRPHARGGVRSYFERPTAMSKRFEMHVTTLNPELKSHDPHTHVAEEIILLLEDAENSKCQTRMLIGDALITAEAGDLYYVGSNILHGIENIGTTPCSYFAFQFE